MRAQEKPRPSRNLGNWITTTERRWTSSPSCSGDSSAVSKTPMGALRARSASRSFRKRVSETMAPPSGGSGSSSVSVVNGSAMITASCAAPPNVSCVDAPNLMSGIELIQIGHVLERLHADAAIGVEEAFAVLSQRQISLHHALHGGADLVLAEARSHDVADARILGA